jgi:hypothetical protein
MSQTRASIGQNKNVPPASVAAVDMKLEVVVIPVSDVERARVFYQSLGWKLDPTPSGVIQFTPHGSGAPCNSAGIARRLPQAPRRVFG